MDSLLTPAHWFRLRDESLDMARKTREVLTDLEGWFKYSANDDRVKRAVGAWLERAQNAQMIGMGRMPVIENCVVIQGGEGVQGKVFVDNRV